MYDSPSPKIPHQFADIEAIHHVGRRQGTFGDFPDAYGPDDDEESSEGRAEGPQSTEEEGGCPFFAFPLAVEAYC